MQCNMYLEIENIYKQYSQLLMAKDYLVIEGAGGLLVPLNEKEFVLELIIKLTKISYYENQSNK